MKVSLSILNANFLKLEESLKDYIDSCDYIHMDIMDGVFVPNISFGPDIVKEVSKITNRDFDTHLMIENPKDYIEAFVKANSKYITFHVEAKSDVMETINLIHSYNVKAGISIKPNTSVDEIKKYLPYVDMVLVMSVEPGFGGQSFMPNSIEKCKKLKELREEFNYNYLINIDGGINDKTISYVKDYVDIVVSGSYICKAKCPKDNLKLLQDIK